MRRFLPLILVLSLGWALGPACDPDDSTTTPTTSTTTTTSGGDNSWFTTCGDPVCSGYGGPFAGVPLCSDIGVSAGDTCGTSTSGDTCDPVDGCNALLTCTDSDPTQQPGGCPISRAAHKTSIAYLDDAQRAEASKELLGMKLATWRYRGDLDDGAQHLGFLIDDAPRSAAVRPDGEHVDLYGYTSLAVAAIQEQQRQIAALEARLAELEAGCRTAD